MRVVAQPELPGAQRGGSGDGGAVVPADCQVAPTRTDRHVFVVTEGVDRPPQYVASSGAGRGHAFACPPRGLPLTRPPPLAGRRQLATDSP
jgi:hypothetical protein